MGTILIVLLILLCVGGLPNWGYASWGYAPSGLLGVILLIVLIFFLMGRL